MIVPAFILNLGQIVATPGAIAAFERTGESPATFLRRHEQADWGDLCDHDRQANEAAVSHEGDTERQARVLSSYRLKDETKVWVITEHNRSVTTVLLPEEY